MFDKLMDHAAQARPGDRVTILGPADPDNRNLAFRPPGDAGCVLIAADETTLSVLPSTDDYRPHPLLP
ncbi:hypothetical protein [Nocardia sp. NPDC050175]|uniref:hypothetical protein n=1 Tax=Nocardia sp. NPDC050175 TaxID=3364317 RepID=UPI0037AAEB4F